MAGFLRRLRARIKYSNNADELKKELDAHRDLAAASFAADGTSDLESRWKAARLLGNTTMAREDARAIWLSRWREQGAQDVRYAIRGLRQSPAFSAAALAVLVAAIGLNTSLFTTLNAVLLRPWPVTHASRVVSVFAGRGTDATVFGGWPAVEYRYLRDHATSVDLVAMRDERVTFDFQPLGVSSPVRIASANYFSTLGVAITRGRGFEPGDDDLDAPRAVAVLSDETWRVGYAAREDLVGQTIRIDNTPFMVIGVAAPRAGDNPLDPPHAAWLPFASLTLVKGDAATRAVLESPSACCQDIAGRLTPGASRETAESELAGLSQQFRRERATQFVGVRVTGTALMDTPRRGTATPVFGLLLAGVLLLLALACANVGNLMLARAMARAQEVQVRLSLGASRARIVRQFLTESLVLSLVAAVVALPIAYWLPGVILGEVSPLAAWGFDTSPDVRVFVFVALLVAGSAMLFGLAPALRVTRGRARLVTGRQAAGDRGTARLRLILLAGQVAVGAVLIVVSALLARGVARVSAAPLGFDAADISVASAWLPAGAYDVARARALADGVLVAIATAGAPTAARVSVAPFQPGHPTAAIRTAGGSADDEIITDWEEVSPGFFAVMGIPIVDRREAADMLTAADEIVVSERLAGLLGGRVIGRTVALRDGRAFRVVAVARDARLTAVDETRPTVYRVGATVRMPEAAASVLTFVTRGDAAHTALARAIVAADPRVRVTTRAVADAVGDQIKPSQVGAAIAGVLGLLAIAISSIGVFGVLSYLVSSRRREIGVRMALGARARSIARLVIAASGWALGAGLLVGLGLSLLAGGALNQYLFGLSPFDPVAFGSAGAILATAALAAVAVPLWRATHVSPSITLRQE